MENILNVETGEIEERPFKRPFELYTGSPGIVFTEKSLTQQHQRDQVNIHKILERHRLTGVVDHVNRTQPRFGDFTQAEDYHGTLNRVLEAQAQFLELPSELRSHFDNDPGRFLEEIGNPEHREFLEELGMPELAEAIHGKKPEEPKPAEPADSGSPAPAQPRTPAPEPSQGS